MKDKEWSFWVASLAADALIDARKLKREDLDVAIEIIAEEILVQLAINNRPTGETPTDPEK